MLLAHSGCVFDPNTSLFQAKSLDGLFLRHLVIFSVGSLSLFNFKKPGYKRRCFTSLLASMSTSDGKTPFPERKYAFGSLLHEKSLADEPQWGSFITSNNNTNVVQFCTRRRQHSQVLQERFCAFRNYSLYSVYTFFSAFLFAVGEEVSQWNEATQASLPIHLWSPSVSLVVLAAAVALLRDR